MNSAQHEAIRTWIKDELGLADANVIWENHPGIGEPTVAAPGYPYVSLALFGKAGQGVPTSKMRKLGDPAGDELADVTLMFRQTLSIKCWAATWHESADMLETLQLSRGKQTVRDQLKAEGLAILREVLADDGAVLQGTEYEGRSEWQLYVGWTKQTTEDRGVIESASFGITIQDPDRSFTVEVDTP